MSLDIYLLSPRTEKPCTCDCGNEHTKMETDTLFDYNITHNLGSMASEAGIYQHLWRPEEMGISKAKDLIEPLTNGLSLLKLNPERFKAFNPENGWGRYENLVEFVSKYLNACNDNPESEISVSR